MFVFFISGWMLLPGGQEKVVDAHAGPQNNLMQFTTVLCVSLQEKNAALITAYYMVLAGNKRRKHILPLS